MMKKMIDAMCVLLAVSCLVSFAGCTAGLGRFQQLDRGQVQFVDLTHAFGSDTIVWPTEQDFRLIVQHAEETAGGYYYASNRMEMPEHGGTHIDAPIHFSKDGQTLDQISLDQLIGTGVRIDVTGPCGRDRDYRVTIQDLERWETAHGRIPDRAVVLMETGYSRFWPSRKEYLGTELRGPDGVRALHFPGLHPDAAAWLIREREVRAVGIDTASIDYGRSTAFEAHVVLLSNGVPVFENLDGVHRLPDRDFDVIALPMKIAEGTGGPLRIIAVLPR